MGKHYAYYQGRIRAMRDIAKIRGRVYRATDAELDSKWWMFKHYAYCMWLGFTAPPVWTKAGQAYNAYMKTSRMLNERTAAKARE